LKTAGARAFIVDWSGSDCAKAPRPKQSMIVMIIFLIRNP
jgi:hypothetical protein